MLGQGSVFIAPGEGSLSAYLASLRRLRELELDVLYPGHGPLVSDPAAKLDEYIAHRLEREQRLLDALDAGLRGRDELLDSAWSDAAPALRDFAALSLASHLEKLAAGGPAPGRRGALVAPSAGLFNTSAMETETSQTQTSTAEVARAYIEAVGRRERDAQTRFYAPGAMNTIHGVIGPAGIDEFRAFFAELYDAFPDFNIQIKEVTSEDDRAAVRWHATGTFSGPGSFQGLSPTGRAIEMEGVDMVTVRDGKVAHLEAFMDGMSLARQLGAMPPKGSPPDKAMLAALNALTKAKEAISAARERR